MIKCDNCRYQKHNLVICNVANLQYQKELLFNEIALSFPFKLLFRSNYKISEGDINCPLEEDRR